ncbi:unnamed protein product [Ectocarpus sp. 12 AP-2014]
MPAMTFGALPYGIFRRVAVCLDRRDIAQLARADVKRVVLSFCLWERKTAGAYKDGKLAPPLVDEEQECVAPLGAPIYRFLGAEDLGSNGEGQHGPKTVLASYPRSGNSLLRKLLEEVTGTITGSDTRPDRTLSRSLSVMGMQGEGVVDHRVRVVKTHYPERPGFRAFDADKAILLVRNPFDAVDSYFNMALTNTHDRSLHDAVYEEFQEFWDGMIRNEMKVWERFNTYWLSRRVPVHVVRYEDLLSDPEATLLSLVAFIHDMSGAEAAERYGDRVRGAPAVVNAGRRRTSKSGEESRCTVAAAPEGTAIVPPQEDGRTGGDGCGSMNGDDDGGTISATPRMGDAATCDKDSTPEAEERGRGREAAAAANSSGSEEATGSAGRSGLYRPRTSGRGVGGGLRRRYSQEQVAWCVRETGAFLRQFGYDPSSQGFPPAVSSRSLRLDRLQSLYATGGPDTSRGSSSAALSSASGIVNGVDRNGVPGCPPGENEVISAVRSGAFTSTLTVNAKMRSSADGAAAATVRDKNDCYCRAMTPFRRSHTQRDTQPLPLEGEDAKAEEWRRRRRAENEAKLRDASGSLVP